jgi:tetratricopeptide (TPR) repeat protein
MQVLVALARANGAVVSRDELIRTCWDGRIVGEDSITRVIGRLRRLAEERGGGAFQIETVPKVGYRLAGDVTPLTANVLPPKPVAMAPQRSRSLILGGAIAAVLLIALAAWRLWPAGEPLTTVHYPGTQTIGAGVPAGLAASIDEATLAAFSVDGQVQIDRGDAKTGTVLRSSVARAGDKLRISSRLENAATGAALWSRVEDQPLARADDVGGWAGGQMASVAHCGLSQQAVYGKALRDDVMRLVYAECAAESGGPSGYAKTLDLARQITATQPDLASGWSTLAFTANGNSFNAPPPEAAKLLAEAKMAVDKALALDPEDSRAWHVKVYLLPGSDLVGKDRAFQRALQARTSWCGCVFTDYGGFLRGVGRAREARQMFNRARTIVPLHPAPLMGLIQLNAAEGRTDEARAGIAEADKIMMDDQMARAIAGSSALWLKDYQGALTDLAGAHMQPPFRAAVADGYQALISGNAARKLAAAKTLATVAEACRCTNSFTVRMTAALGDAPAALTALEEIVASGRIEPIMSTIAWDPVLADVRRLPGYAALAEKVGLVRYWQTMKVKPDFCTNAAAPPVCAAI